MITSYYMPNFENKLAIPLPCTIKIALATVMQSVPLEQSTLSCQQATSLTKFRRLLINSDTAFMKNRL